MEGEKEGRKLGVRDEDRWGRRKVGREERKEGRKIGAIQDKGVSRWGLYTGNNYTRIITNR